MSVFAATSLIEAFSEDVFASANTKEMDALVASGLVSADATVLFAGNLEGVTQTMPLGDLSGIRAQPGSDEEVGKKQ